MEETRDEATTMRASLRTNLATMFDNTCIPTEDENLQ
jgi:hypothetical protein